MTVHANGTETTVVVPIEATGSSCGSRFARVTIDGKPTELRIVKGTRGVKVGAMLKVRIEYRDWFTMTRTSINMRDRTSETTEYRQPYHDGAVHAHPFVVGVAKHS